MLKKLVAIFLLFPCLSFAEEFVEGRDFQTVANPQAIATASKEPSVVEFFSYGCPWCYKMEGPFNEWDKQVGNAVHINRVPVVFKPEWELYAKAYYTAKMLAMDDKVTPLLFKAIQEDKKPLNTKEAMIDFFVAQGVDREIAKSAFENSPSIDMRVKNGTTLMSSYQIMGVPAFVVNNKYKTDLQMAKDPQRLFLILSYLVKKS